MHLIRILDTDLAHPFRTGALDEALLRARAGDIVPDTLHFYRRDPPGVSVGYFGRVATDVDLGYCEANGIAVLRRLSGGSAIFTDSRQLVYAFVTKGALPSTPNRAYAMACSALVRAFARLGVDASFKPINDVQHRGRKLSGSALTRRWGASLVHGTVLVEVDRERMFRALRVDPGDVTAKGLSSPGDRVTSLAEALGRTPPMAEVKEAMVRGFEKQFGARASPGFLTGWEAEMADRLVSEKYGTGAWNLRR
jgi:lipoate-protein ligase A